MLFFAKELSSDSQASLQRDLALLFRASVKVSGSGSITLAISAKYAGLLKFSPLPQFLGNHHVP